MNLNLNLLQRFVAVAEMRSVNKASERLNLSQPAVSKSIQQLEQSLDAQLLARGPRGITLTDFGQVVFRHAKLVLAGMRTLEGEIAALKDLSVGDLRVGVPPGPGFVSDVLPAAAKALVDGSRRIKIDISIGNRSVLIGPLLRGDLDFIVTSLSRDDEEDFIQEELFVERSVLAVDKDHPIAGPGPASLSEIACYPWAVLGAEDLAEEALRKRMRAAGTPHESALFRSNSSLAIKSLLTKGDWIGFINIEAVRREFEQGLMREVSLDEPDFSGRSLPSHSFGILRRKDVPLSTIGRKLIEQIKQAQGNRDNKSACD